jgi:hypothetical protein
MFRDANRATFRDALHFLDTLGYPIYSLVSFIYGAN